jgi:hypothetical protein
MGLDLVEYVIAIEDAFEISIPDADAAELDTPGKLVDYLCARLGEARDGAPLIQTVFYRLRAALATELGVERSRIRPQTMLGDLTDRPSSAVWRPLLRVSESRRSFSRTLRLRGGWRSSDSCRRDR